MASLRLCGVLFIVDKAGKLRISTGLGGQRAQAERTALSWRGLAECEAQERVGTLTRNGRTRVLSGQEGVKGCLPNNRDLHDRQRY